MLTCIDWNYWAASEAAVVDVAAAAGVHSESCRLFLHRYIYIY